LIAKILVTRYLDIGDGDKAGLTCRFDAVHLSGLSRKCFR